MVARDTKFSIADRLKSAVLQSSKDENGKVVVTSHSFQGRPNEKVEYIL